MPLLTSMVADTAESVLRPIIHEIARDLFQVTGIDPLTTIFFPGDHDRAKQTGSSITPSSEHARMSAGSKLTIDVDENYEMERVLATAVQRPENLFIFRDDAIETSIKPAYSPSDVTINFRFRAVDETSAIRFRDDIKTRVSMGQTERLHSLSYHYLIPKEFLVILEELHRMREAVAGYGDTYEDYFKARVTKRATVLSNLSGEQTAWAIAETQLRVQGWFTFEGAPEKGEKNSDIDTWQVNFSYRFKYERPVACVMQYPLVVHNQLVGQRFRPSPADKVERAENYARSYSLSAQNFGYFEKGSGINQAVVQPPWPGIQIPEFDEFIPASVVTSTKRVFTILTTVDPMQPTLLLNLGDLGTRWKIQPGVLAYLLAVRDRLPYPNAAPFLLTLYRDRNIVANNALVVDANGDVHSTTPLSLRHYYHVRLGLQTNWRTIDTPALDLLREDGETLTRVISSVSPLLNLRPGMLSTGYVPRRSLAAAIDQLESQNLAQGGNRTYQFNTVQGLFVQAIPLTDLQQE